MKWFRRPEKSLRAWWLISRLPCDDGYVRGIKPSLPARQDKLRLPSKAERAKQVRRIA